MIDELRELNVEVDFNQGLDARLVTEEVAEALKGLNIPTIRLAYDFVGMRDSVQRAVLLLNKSGLTNRRFRHICCYVLYNYKDTPQDLYERVRDLLAWGVSAYPMRFQPLKGEGAFEKDSYVSPQWTAEKLDMVAQARRVIGYGGAFPPYDGLIDKFRKAADFRDAFGLRPHPTGKTRKSYTKQPSRADGFELRDYAWDLIEMGKDHQFPIPMPDRMMDERGQPKTKTAPRRRKKPAPAQLVGLSRV